MSEAALNTLISVVVSVAGFLLARSQLLATLEERAKSQQKEIDELRTRLNNEFIDSVDRLREKVEQLSVKVELALDRIEHVSKRPVHIDQGDLSKLLDMIAEVSKK